MITNKKIENPITIEAARVKKGPVVGIYLRADTKDFYFDESTGSKFKDGKSIPIIYLYIYNCPDSENKKEYLRNMIEIEVPELDNFNFPMIHAFKNKEEIYINIYKYPEEDYTQLEIEEEV
jgi:hypothetical protein